MLDIASAHRFQIAGESAEIVVSALRADPYAKAGLQLVGQLGRRIQLVRELAVELPESGLVLRRSRCSRRVHSADLIVIVVPAIIHDIAVQRLYAVLRQSFFCAEERSLDAGITDIHHVVIPGIILLAECRRRSDIFDVIKEICLYDSGLCALRCADHIVPCAEHVSVSDILSIFCHLRDGLSGIIADLHRVIFDICFLCGEL